MSKQNPVKTDIKIMKAIPSSGGNLALIARRCWLDRETVVNHIKKSKELTQALETETEAVLDMAEDLVTTNIKYGIKLQEKYSRSYRTVDSSDARWYLTKKAKQRGYGDEVVHNTNLNVKQHSIKIGKQEVTFE